MLWRWLTFFWVFQISLGAVSAPEMVQIPAGKVTAFWQRPISLKDRNKIPKLPVAKFKMMSRAVTVEDYSEFLKLHSEWSKEKASKLFTDSAYLEFFKPAQLKSPATSVSWFAARAYCDSLGMRLPTLNEWEYVAAASENQKDANNNEKFLKRILEWYGETQPEILKPVGSIYKNLYGLWDMHGLIWEWVEDFNTNFVTGESREDSSFNKDMFCGAGSMVSGNKENYAAFMRFAFRSSLTGQSSVWNLGFRCVEEIK